MSRLKPQSTVQTLALAGGALGAAAGVSEAIGGLGEFPAGVAMGLWFAAAWLWSRGEAC